MHVLGDAGASSCPLCLALTPNAVVLQVKLMRQADRTLELLEVDEAKYADDLSTQQTEFASSINTLSTVSDQQTRSSVPQLMLEGTDRLAKASHVHRG